MARTGTGVATKARDGRRTRIRRHRAPWPEGAARIAAIAANLAGLAALLAAAVAAWGP